LFHVQLKFDKSWLIFKGPWPFFLKKHPKAAISSSRGPNEFLKTFFTFNYRILP
jgi:hypothetical protein